MCVRKLPTWTILRHSASLISGSSIPTLPSTIDYAIPVRDRNCGTISTRDVTCPRVSNGITNKL